MSNNIKIAIDDRWQEGGIGRFYREILARLSQKPIDMDFLALKTSIQDPLAPIKLARKLAASSADLFWSPGFIPPAYSRIPVILTVHDLIHRMYGGVVRKSYLDFVLRPLMKKANKIVTVSEHSKAKIQSWLCSQDTGVEVIGCGVSEVFRRELEPACLNAPYVLYVGNYRTHKNIPRLIEAFSKSDVSKTMLLVFSGNPDQTVLRLAQDHGVFNHVVFLNQPDETTLAQFYRGAKAVIQVSLEEGFGLPVVEAMASGVPVVCSNRSSLAEIAGDAAIQVNPFDVQEIANGIDVVLGDEKLRERLCAKGLEKVDDYHWDRVAQRLYSMWLEVDQARHVKNHNP